MNYKITGSGSCIPTNNQDNGAFLSQSFYDDNGVELELDNQIIIDKFNSITGIEQRKYINKELNTSDIAAVAAQDAIEDAQIDPETLDYIIVAHNFGDIPYGSKQIDTLPNLAARVKSKLKIKNPSCVAYDILFGCPGWVEGMIQAKAFIKAGMATKCLVVGADALSRVIDKYDRDSMIFADGAGATILEATDEDGGVLSHTSATYTSENEAEFIYYGNSCNTKADQSEKYIKMQGRKVYEFALSHVPAAMKKCLDDANIEIDQLKKYLFIRRIKKWMKPLQKGFIDFIRFQCLRISFL